MTKRAIKSLENASKAQENLLNYALFIKSLASLTYSQFLK